MEGIQVIRIEINSRILELVQGDITDQRTDAIVNAANSGLRGGAGVDGAIHRVGGPEIMKECRHLGGCPPGSACLTTAGKLRAKFVIHAVGPIWCGGDDSEPQLLAGAYQKSLDIAKEQRLRSISFPSISTGAYRFPLNQAAGIALSTVRQNLAGDTSLELAVFVLFNQDSFDAYRRVINAW